MVCVYVCVCVCVCVCACVYVCWFIYHPDVVYEITYNFTFERLKYHNLKGHNFYCYVN